MNLFSENSEATASDGGIFLPAATSTVAAAIAIPESATAVRGALSSSQALGDSTPRSPSALEGHAQRVTKSGASAIANDFEPNRNPPPRGATSIAATTSSSSSSSAVGVSSGYRVVGPPTKTEECPAEKISCAEQIHHDTGAAKKRQSTGPTIAAADGSVPLNSVEAVAATLRTTTSCSSAGESSQGESSALAAAQSDWNFEAAGLESGSPVAPSMPGLQKPDGRIARLQNPARWQDCTNPEVTAESLVESTRESQAWSAGFQKLPLAKLVLRMLQISLDRRAAVSEPGSGRQPRDLFWVPPLAPPTEACGQAARGTVSRCAAAPVSSGGEGTVIASSHPESSQQESSSPVGAADLLQRGDGLGFLHQNLSQAEIALGPVKPPLRNRKDSACRGGGETAVSPLPNFLNNRPILKLRPPSFPPAASHVFVAFGVLAKLFVGRVVCLAMEYCTRPMHTDHEPLCCRSTTASHQHRIHEEEEEEEAAYLETTVPTGSAAPNIRSTHVTTPAPTGSAAPNIRSTHVTTPAPTGSAAPNIRSTHVTTPAPTGSAAPNIRSTHVTTPAGPVSPPGPTSVFLKSKRCSADSTGDGSSDDDVSSRDTQIKPPSERIDDKATLRRFKHPWAQLEPIDVVTALKMLRRDCLLRRRRCVEREKIRETSLEPAAAAVGAANLSNDNMNEASTVHDPLDATAAAEGSATGLRVCASDEPPRKVHRHDSETRHRRPHHKSQYNYFHNDHTTESKQQPQS